MENFGDVIKRKREMKGWTQKDLAKRINVSSKSVSRWETNHGYPDITLLPVITRTLELDYYELLESNEYLLKCRQKKLNRIKIVIVCCIFCLILGGLGYFSYQMHNDDILDIRYHLIHDDWGYLGFDNGNSYFHVNQKNKEDILNILYFDEWKKVDMSQEQMKSMEDGYQWQITCHDITIYYYELNHHYYLKAIYDSKGFKTEMYEVDKPISRVDNYIFDYEKNWFGFSRHHSITTNSNQLRELQKEETQNLVYEYSIQQEDLENRYLFIEDNENKRYYFIFSNSQYDFQNIDIDEKNLTIKLNGFQYYYQNCYVHVFELKTPIFKLYVNDQEVSPYSITTLSYSAKSLNK